MGGNRRAGETLDGSDRRAFGMIRFDESLAEHVRAGRIDEATALAVAENKKLVYQTDGMRLAEGLDHEVMRNAGFDRERGYRKKD